MHHFRIDAIHDPQSLPRLAGFFAQRAIVPSTMQMQTCDGQIQIIVTVAALDPGRASMIASKISQMFAVINVMLDGELVA